MGTRNRSGGRRAQARATAGYSSFRKANSRLKKLLQVFGEPIATVCLVIPAKDVTFLNLSIPMNRKFKTVSTDVISKQKKVPWLQ